MRARDDLALTQISKNTQPANRNGFCKSRVMRSPGTISFDGPVPHNLLDYEKGSSLEPMLTVHVYTPEFPHSLQAIVEKLNIQRFASGQETKKGMGSRFTRALGLKL